MKRTQIPAYDFGWLAPYMRSHALLDDAVALMMKLPAKPAAPETPSLPPVASPVPRDPDSAVLDARRRKPRTTGPVTEDGLRDALMNAVRELGRGQSVCPTEVAKSLFGLEWRGSMERVRNAAARLVFDGALVMTSRGRIVDPVELRGGNFRLALPPEGF